MESQGKTLYLFLRYRGEVAVVSAGQAATHDFQTCLGQPLSLLRVRVPSLDIILALGIAEEPILQ